jgi:hypothetical protein
MPLRATRGRRVTGSVFELELPRGSSLARAFGMRTRGRSRAGGDGGAAPQGSDPSCYICANDFCGPERCCRALTHLACCTQPICCGCLLRTSFRCACKDDCDEVVSHCPFCKTVSPVTALDVFLGQTKVCGACSEDDDAQAAAAAGSGTDAEEADTDTDTETLTGTETSDDLDSSLDSMYSRSELRRLLARLAR